MLTISFQQLCILGAAGVRHAPRTCGPLVNPRIAHSSSSCRDQCADLPCSVGKPVPLMHRLWVQMQQYRQRLPPRHAYACDQHYGGCCSRAVLAIGFLNTLEGRASTAHFPARVTVTKVDLTPHHVHAHRCSFSRKHSFRATGCIEYNFQLLSGLYTTARPRNLHLFCVSLGHHGRKGKEGT